MASTCTVDASVFLNAFNPYEAGHETSRRFLALLQERATPIIAPTLLLPEVAAAIGRGRGRYRLTEAAAVHPLDGWEATVYSAEDELVRDQDLSVSRTDLAAAAEALPLDRLTVEFLTPTRLKHGGHFVDAPEFHVLIRVLLRRVSSLAYFHGGQRWETDYRGWIERAKGVRLVENDTR